MRLRWMMGKILANPTLLYTILWVGGGMVWLIVLIIDDDYRLVRVVTMISYFVAGILFLRQALHNRNRGD